ncbi:PHP domain-containing protein [Armatimonas rosea]|uniref:DNA polymerase (Family 10) n=1 Tax=Armatimonas rosea TaxID=685828 RepID=A0A7W9SN65_ARMRO|nr:PHP domain-containing protein [Armatimonas rosea]MBB6049701.1 DNA polymerase (family 10) [Armatimonas rosea]
MTNYEIARRFEAIADILEIQGENPFKVRAYRVAAETIDDLEDDLATIHAHGKLRELPGFGEAIASKTADFLASGTTAIWERIKDSVPTGVVKMASVPGVGPRTAKALWEALEVTSVEALEAACREQRVRAVAGFGAAKETKLLEKIEAWKRLNEKMPRRWALPLAEKLAAELRKIEGVERVEIAGELRRGCESVEKIILCVFAPEFGIELPALPERVECIVVAGKGTYGWGDTELLATGPEAFTQTLTDMTDVDDLEIASDEGLAFAFANVPFIEPELRDWPDVIELAKAGKLPKLITEADFKGQLHEHTTWSDGTASIREMAEAALERGYEYLAITDHSPLLAIANGLSRERVLAQLDEIESLRPEFAARGLAILSGLEVDILKDGTLDMDDDVLAKLDIVVASVHMRYKEDEAAMTQRICTALASPHVDILGHPTGRIMGQREGYPLDIDAVIAAAAKHKKALEINASPERMDLCDEHVKKAKAAGVKIAINCDAHSTKSLGNLSWGLCIARRAGLEASDVLNCWDLATLRGWLG